MKPAYFQREHPRVFGHRGAAGLAPENTLPSFALALELGANFLEMDVHGTRDGEIVVFHDSTLERTTNGEGAINELTLSQLKELDAGYQFSRDGRDFPYRGQGIRVPTFREVLERLPAVPCNVEVKQGSPAIAEEVVDIVHRAGAQERILLAAEHGEIMDHVRRSCGEIPTSFSTLDMIDFMARVQQCSWEGYIPPGTALQIPPRFGETELVSSTTLRIAHDLGLEIHVWTINQADEMRDLLEMGVDGIISDLPGLARQVVDEFRRLA